MIDFIALLPVYVLFVLIIFGMTNGELWEESEEWHDYGFWKNTKEVVDGWNLRLFIIPFAYILVALGGTFLFVISGYILAYPFKIIKFILFKKN